MDKYKNDNPSLSLKDSRLQARKKFQALSNKKKLHLIKEAAENYDKEIDAPTENISLKKPFANYLTKSEQKLLMESYGMPQTIPK